MKFDPSVGIIELARILNSTSDNDEIIRLSSTKLSEWSGADITQIMVINPNTQETIKTIIKEEKNEIPNKYHFVNLALSGWVLKNYSTFYSSDLKKDDRFRKALFDKTPFKSALCIPIINEDTIIGAIIFLNTNGGNSYSDDEIEYFENCALIIAPFLRNNRQIHEFFTSTLPKESLLKRFESFGMIGKSDNYLKLLRSIESAAKCNVRVLLEGETGSGKELIAKAIHKMSARKDEPFVVLDCGAIPQNLIESELFGHIKGAFTGATAERKGLIEEADKSTLFIDEICYLPIELQAKFLRFIQEGEFRPLGSNEIKKVDVRIISASSVPIVKLTTEGKFREELYYRLNVYPIDVPPLEKRREDIPLLARNFLAKFNDEQNKSIEMLDDKIMFLLTKRRWNGNIRELENLVERLVTLTDNNTKIAGINILPNELKKELKSLQQQEDENINILPLTKSLAQLEEKLIKAALNEYKWNQCRAAKALGIKEQTLRYKMNKFGIINPT